MSIIKNFIIIFFLTTFIGQTNAEEVKKMGKHKDWETYVINNEQGKVCFAQSKPVLQAPKKNPREARLFITFRPGEKIANEISITAGYEFNTKNSITATSGKNKYKFDLAQMSLKFCEIQPFMTSVIIGATTMEQLKTDVESVNVNLTEEIIKEINEVQKIYPNPCP